MKVKIITGMTYKSMETAFNDFVKGKDIIEVQVTDFSYHIFYR